MPAVLMTAFHYPPYRGSSGIQRTLKFSRYLPESGWRPFVLTATANAYPERADDLQREIPEHVVVARALSFDTARHLSIAGRYPAWLAWPDRWGTWLGVGVLRGLHMARSHNIDVLWSTFPIATAHVIAATIKSVTRLPWVADFRDPMWEDSYPADPSMRRRSARIEARTVARADRVVVTTEGTRELMLRRYPDVLPEKFVVIPNGYDEENFVQSELKAQRSDGGAGPARVVHSGTLYPRERDPSALLEALSQLKLSGRLDPSELQVTLRATAHDAEILTLVNKYDVGDIVKLAPPLPYVEALTEMMEADAVLLLQGEDCNQQVPAKLYEYLRAGTPVLALAGKDSDTVRILEGGGKIWWAPPATPGLIAAAVEKLLREHRSAARQINWDYVRRFERRNQASDLARLLGGCLALRS